MHVSCFPRLKGKVERKPPRHGENPGELTGRPQFLTVPEGPRRGHTTYRAGWSRTELAPCVASSDTQLPGKRARSHALVRDRKVSSYPIALIQPRPTQNLQILASKFNRIPTFLDELATSTEGIRIQISMYTTGIPRPSGCLRRCKIA